jgi:excisionase family DNA binding protein
MPRTRKPAQPAAQQPAPDGPAPAEVFTLAEAAAYLRLPEADVLQMVREQGLPARRVGSEWRFLKAAVQHWLALGSPPPVGSKEALLAAAGAFKDDPDLLAIVEDAYRRRGRPITEDGSYELLYGLEPGSGNK